MGQANGSDARLRPVQRVFDHLDGTLDAKTKTVFVS